MRIFYDGMNYFPPQGVGRYFRNVIERLPATTTPVLAVTNLQTALLPRHPALETVVGYTVPSLRAYLRSAALRSLATRQLRARSKGLRYDIAHPTYYQLLVGQPFDWLRGPVVVTVYDMIHEVFPGLDPSGRVREAKRAAVARADLVLCISDHTRADLLERYPVPEDRVVTTHLASDLSAAMASGPEPVPERPYVLYVGARAGYKNFALVVDALAHLAPSIGDLRLAVAGPRFTSVERQDLADRGLATTVQHVGRVTDHHLAKLYRESLALVYPSRYEGFGIPPLEAMACGTAVIAADATSIPEVVGEAALLVDPSSADELAQAIRAIHDEPATRARLVEAGAARVTRFDWRITADRTEAVYRQLR